MSVLITKSTKIKSSFIELDVHLVVVMLPLSESSFRSTEDAGGVLLVFDVLFTGEFWFRIEDRMSPVGDEGDCWVGYLDVSKLLNGTSGKTRFASLGAREVFLLSANAPTLIVSLKEEVKSSLKIINNPWVKSYIQERRDKSIKEHFLAINSEEEDTMFLHSIPF